MALAYLGLGSNLGDRLGNLGQAVELLAARAGVGVLRSSRVFETDPVGGPPQRSYLNAVLEVETDLPPRGLLAAGLAVEARLGRVRAERWGPRVIDVDLLVFDGERIEEPDLVVPHPRLLQRAFVLVPLMELVPDLELPGVGRVACLRLPVDPFGVRPFAPPLRTPPGGGR